MGRSSGATLIPQQQLIINGNGDVAQRATTQAAAPTTLNIDTSFVIDRCFLLPAGHTCAIAQDTTAAHLGTGCVSGVQATGEASVTTVNYGQIISSKKAALYKRPLYVSCAVYNNSGGAFTPVLRAMTPGTAESNAGRTWTTINNAGAGDALQSCANGAVTVVHGVIDPTAYANIANGLRIDIQKPSTFTSGTVTFSQLSVKPVAAYPLFVAEDPDLEFQRCLLYAEVLGGSAPGFSPIAVGKANGNTSGTYPLFFSKKRANATLRLSGTPADYAVSDVTGSLLTVTGTANNSPTPQSIFVVLTVASGLTNGNGSTWSFNNPGSSNILIAAELS